MASTWDLWRNDTANWADRHLFLDFVQEFGEPFLDLGCGTGRLLLDYRALGLDGDGLDDSPEMLGICRSKADALGLSVTLLEERLPAPRLPRRYRTILAPSSILQLMTSEEDARSLVQNLYNALEPGGVLAGSFAFEWREGEPMDTGWEMLFERTRPSDQATVRSWTREWREPARRLWHTEQKFEVTIEGSVVHEEHQIRSPEGMWYSQAQARQLFEQAGFKDVSILHEFSHEPVRDEDRLFVALGKRDTL